MTSKVSAMWCFCSPTFVIKFVICFQFLLSQVVKLIGMFFSVVFDMPEIHSGESGLNTSKRWFQKKISPVVGISFSCCFHSTGIIVITAPCQVEKESCSVLFALKMCHSG